MQNTFSDMMAHFVRSKKAKHFEKWSLANPGVSICHFAAATAATKN